MGTGRYPIAGIFQYAGQSRAEQALARVADSGGVTLMSPEEHSLLLHASAGEYDYGPVVPGLPVELLFRDGSRFIPLDVQFRWPGLASSSRIPEWLESHWLAVLLAVLLIPGFVWLMNTQIIPTASKVGVAMLPEQIGEEMGQQTLQILDRLYLKPSLLDDEQQHIVREQWQSTLNRLSLQHSSYQLEFRSGKLGANAFALPDGTVILTDELVGLMEHDPQQLLAVMLHEIGHVEHRHSLQLVARTTAMSMLFALMFGDVEGAGELVLGAGSSLLQNSFSREMEREADRFALHTLQQLGVPPHAFADAMEALRQQRGDTGDSDDKRWLEYLSTHPDSAERIDNARSFAVPPAQ